MLIKRHRKKALIFMMIFCMVFTMMPAMAFAAEGTNTDAAGAEISEEKPVPGGEGQMAPEQNDEAGGQAAETKDSAEEAPVEEEAAAAESGEEAEETEEAAEEEIPAGDDTENETFDAERSDYLSYDPLYIIQYADPAYADVSEVDMERFVNIVTAAKGIATYNVRTQSDFDVKGENYIAGMNYEMPVYNVDDDSEYYLAIPDVNMFNGGFAAYDIDVAYNNDFAEMISGYKYEKGILYIPKSAIDHPKNKSGVPEGSVIAVQMNYAIGDDMDFTKSIPVQILKKDEPVEKTVHTSNLFEQGITVKTGVKGRREEDISVFLNGHMIPVNDGSWTYDKGSGELYIHEMPGVVSNINVVFRDRTAIEAVKDAAVSLIERTAIESYAAGVSTGDMECFRTLEGKEVVLKISGGELFTGWRGHYTATRVIHGRQGSQTHEQAEEAKKKLKGWKNSVQYLYGGYTDLSGAGTSLIDNNAGKKEFDARVAATWAISSYAVGADAGLMNDDGKLTQEKMVTHNVPVTEGGKTTYNTTEKHTIYEWLMIYQNQLKKSNGATSNNHNNGIAGATNFAVTFPDSIQGSSLSLVSEGANKGRSNDTVTITSDSMDSSYYIAASCNHLDDVAASDKDTDIYVTCLSLTDDYAVLAFAQARGGQNASAIYKFRLEKKTGYVKAVKSSADAVLTGSLSGYSLAGAEYQVFADQACTQPAKDGNGGNVILTTAANGETNAVQLQTREYWIKEIKASKGYRLDPTTYHITVTSDNGENDPAKFTSKEPPVFGEPDFMVFKTDLSSKAAWDKVGKAAFTIKYYDVADKADISKAAPVRSWTFETSSKPAPENAPAGTKWSGFDWQADKPVSGERWTAGNKYVIPVGWFVIEETTPPDGFKLTKEKCYGHVYQDANGNAKTDLEGANADGRLKKQTFTFKDEHYKTVVRKINAAGAGLAGAKLQILSGQTVIKEWTSGAEAETFDDIAPGAYTLREISAPYGYELAGDQSFSVAADKDTAVSMKNTPVTVKTTAVSAATNKHTGTRKKDEKITDTVHVTGLVKDRKYKLTGRLMNRRTGSAVKGAASDKDFTATAESMDVTMDFTFDSTALAEGDSVVVYETLYRTSAVHNETVPVELQKHCDINDTAQTVIYPGISTTAADKASSTHHLLASAGAVIRDTVTYKGLVPGETYALEGELYDKTTGRLTGIKAAASLKPETSEGTASIEFTFDASGLKGHTLVVYETLKLGTAAVAEHKDPDDGPQTIYVPRIGTKAAISGDNSVLTDTVEYENLLPDHKYVFRGWLVDTASGTKVPGSDGSIALDSGKKTSGSVEMKMDTSKFAEMTGSSITAFEELYVIVKENGTDKEVKVAEHKDRSGNADTNPQTVGIFHDLKVRKNVTGNLGDLTKVFEYTAEFTGLVPGQAYKIEGDDEKTFMADQSGKASAAIRLKDGQTAVIRKLPKGATYKVTEAASDHIAEYRMFSEDMADKGAKIIKAEDSNGADAGKMLATAVETVDLFDGTVVILWENNRDLATLTGVITYTGLWAAAFAAVLAGLALLVIKRRRYASDEKHTFG